MDQFDRHGDNDYVDFEAAQDGCRAGERQDANFAMPESARMGMEASSEMSSEYDDERSTVELDDSEDSEETDELMAESSDEQTAEDEELPSISRKVRRRRKRSRPRSKTIAMKRLTREELRLGALMYPPVDMARPRTRSECQVEQRPCPWVACKHHLYLDVNPETGSIKINFPDLEPWQLEHTCALDVADRGGITLEEVGEIMNLTRERIRQVEVRGLRKLRAASPSPDELGAAIDEMED